MDIISGYQQVGLYRAAADLGGTTHKTVKRMIEKLESDNPPLRAERGHNYDAVAEMVAERVEKSPGRMLVKLMCRSPRRRLRRLDPQFPATDCASESVVAHRG